ncbi:2-amino-4-hydroxy-6-hydroxymethyldihydropteridine diphosphokinase [Ramlibacter sp. WS9]|uniref:2-amino-4-hydroxy-6- hydroxymethyldihydropteridine diphosphokinase n=1 Tax=Ramlibacter sp. WS9 TaxID=1882741 RepID=UPI001144D465|nr:2-amino-4-hydroxy-6-hydroxymethyldihydropteridine diphosphokinase [Ramlibacter sp. WS9]ROZ69706.1 2-amino-4-hydroxy-6-hydroxymethyldihydropteridine diphosphokinase [Ramlibacter sp. WS9]
MRDPVVAYVALGANLGGAVVAVLDAIESIGTLPDTEITGRSSLYRTAPVDSSGPDYINAVVEVSTRLCAPELLSRLQAIEAAAGRERPYRNAPRTLDLDILLFGSARIDSARLEVPHPRMYERAFVLIPLAEIAPHQVQADQLAAVAKQGISRIPS